MLPDFPKVRRKIDSLFFEEFFKSRRAAAPFVDMLRHQIQHEGKSSTHQLEDGAIRNLNYERIGVDIAIQYEPERGRTLQELLAKAQEAGREMGAKMEKMTFEKLGETTRRTGNVLDMKGRAIDGEALAELIEKTQMDFDEKGNPRSSLFLAPSLLKSLESKIPEWEKDARLQARFKEIHTKQFQAFREREANRRLVE